jgi:predicted amidophosphoribosyltransferase
MDFHYWKWILLLAILPVLWLLRRLIRPRPVAGQCNTCGYNLTANTSGVCPECGTPAAQKPEAVA